jgi:hypothetical protein
MVMALLFTGIAATFTVALYSSTTQSRSATRSLLAASRSAVSADAALKWFDHRLLRLQADGRLPSTTAGVITEEVAEGLWTSLANALRTDLDSLYRDFDANGMNDAVVVGNETTRRSRYYEDTRLLESMPLSIDGGQTFFQLQIQQLEGDARIIRVTARAWEDQYQTERLSSVDYTIDKKIRFAVLGRTRIQLGRNTVVEGPVATTSNRTNPREPLLVLSDFMHLDSTLTGTVQAFYDFVEENGSGYGKRIRAGTQLAYDAADEGFTDYNGDGWIDDYDLFTEHFDSDGDLSVSADEFTDPITNELYDANLFAAIDWLNGPLYDGDVERLGHENGLLDRRDGYAKVRGKLITTLEESTWQNELEVSGRTIHDLVRGSIVSPDGTDELTLGAAANSLINLAPSQFEEAASNFRERSGSAGGTALRTTGRIENTTLTAADVQFNDGEALVQIATAGGTGLAVNSLVTVTQFNSANATASAAGKAQATHRGQNVAREETPFGASANSHQATYRRPIFRNITFRNVIVPPGLNALFENCTFEGVTFVDTQRDITRSNGSVTTSSSDAMSWSQRTVTAGSSQASNFRDRELIASGTPGSNQLITQGSKNGNNIRFNNCTFRGPIANNYSTAYTHFANSWEFTGNTFFDNVVDDTATIVAPQTNIEMGSFTRPDEAVSRLVGVVVAGNIDIRGTSIVDGSIINTGDGAGNITLGYFGPRDDQTNPSAMPEGGYGRLNIRYNPNRALPDGINIAVEVVPTAGSYRENATWIATEPW